MKYMPALRRWISLLRSTWNGYSSDNVPRLGAALSYYTAFSLASLIVIATAIAAFFLGGQAVNDEVGSTLRGTIGENGAKAVHDMAASANQSGGGAIATALGIIALILGASGVFVELQSSLNTIWGVEPKPYRGIWGVIRNRILSLTMVICTGFLLLVSLLVSAFLSGTGKFLSGALPGGEVLWFVINAVASFAIISIMFGLIFKYVPDVKIAWRDVWIGAVVTGGLFTIGKSLLGLYLGRSSVASAYGAAGSLAIVLLWVYYVSQIVFFGAEFTKAYALQLGSDGKPDESPWQ